MKIIILSIALVGLLVVLEPVDSFVLPRLRGSNVSFTCLASASCYLWNVPIGSESCLISDLLLELGAESVMLDIPSSGVETDDEFEKTGKLRSIAATQLKFTTLNDEKAQLLVQQVCEILGTDGEEAWKSQCTRDLLLENIDSEASKVIYDPTAFNVADRVLYVHCTLESSDEAFAFGDGNHATTRVSMKGLEKYVANDAKVLDYGCGTGILGLTAKALGASSITAVDISSQALQITEINWRLNYPDGQDFTIMSSADFTPCGIYDVVSWLFSLVIVSRIWKLFFCYVVSHHCTVVPLTFAGGCKHPSKYIGGSARQPCSLD